MIFGFISSSLPNLLKYLEERQRLKYNVQIVSLQLEATLRNIDAAKEIAKIKQEIEDSTSARNHDNSLNGGPFINFIRASVRPIVTFSFVSLYIGIKLIVLFILYKEGLNINNIEIVSKIILDDTTIAILATILGFWFGSRAMLNKEK